MTVITEFRIVVPVNKIKNIELTTKTLKDLSCQKIDAVFFLRMAFVFITLLIMSENLTAQKVLVVEKIGKFRHYNFYEGEKCKIRAALPDTLLRGTLWLNDDSSIAVSGWRPYQVDLKNITSVYKRFGFPSKSAPVIAIGGVGIFAIIAFNHLINNEQVFTSDMFIISGTMLGISAITFSLSEKKIRIGKRWKVKILDYSFSKESN